MTVENISWSISTKGYRPRRGLNTRPPVSSPTAHPSKPPRPAKRALTHFSLETPKRGNYQCRSKSDAVQCGVWLVSPLFVNSLAIFSKAYLNHLNEIWPTWNSCLQLLKLHLVCLQGAEKKRPNETMSVDLPVYFITIDSSSWRAKRPSSTLKNGTTPSRSLRKNMDINSTTEKIPLARMVPAGFLINRRGR